MSGVKRDVVLVYWDDAATRTGWHPRNAAEDDAAAGFPCISVGFLVKRTAKAITIVQSEASENGKCGEAITIPMGCVRRTKRLARVELP